MNRYPWWKYAILAVALLIGLLYTVPNLYGEAPAVQVSSGKATVKIDAGMVQRVEQALQAAGLQADFVQFDGNSVRARFRDTDTQIKAKDAVAKALNPDASNPSWIVALNLVSRSPAWMARLHALPMYLGLDLRGGVHFLMQVDMKSALTKKAESFTGDMRTLLRDKNIRHAGISRDGDNVEVRFRDAATLATARNLLSDQLPDLAWTEAADGADLKLVGTLKPEAARRVQEQAVKQNITTLHNRVNELGVAEPVIQQSGLDRVVVQLPGVQDTAKAKDIIGRTATLEIRMVNETSEARDAITGAGPVPFGSERFLERGGQPVIVYRSVVLTGENLTDAQPGFDSQTQEPTVNLTLDAKGARIFKDVTRENVGKRMAIILFEKGKGEVVTAPVIRSEIAGGRVQISGTMTTQEANDQSLLLRAGSLAAPMEIIEERTIGPSLGAENIDKGINSVVYGFLAIAVFMCAYYLLFGVFSTLALAFNLLILVAVLSMLQATLSLPGMAAIALVLGMAIDSNVLINERVREELRGGASPQAAINAGYERAFATILDSNITTLIAGLALLAFGSGPVRGFAVVHCLGIATSMFSSVMFSRGLVNLWYGRKKKLKSVSIGQVWRPDGAVVAPKGEGELSMEFFRIKRDIPFMRHALVLNVVSFITFALAVFFLVTRGLHLSIEFTGGTVIEVAYEQPADLNRTRAAVEALGFGEVQVQNFGTSRDVMIRLPVRQGEKQTEVAARVFDALCKAESGTTGTKEYTTDKGEQVSRPSCSVASGAEPLKLSRTEVVGPSVGEELTWDGLMALGATVIGIMAYLAIRFEWKFAVAGIIANLHDVVIILGFFAFFQWEFSLAVLAAILAVLGYSVNESVVIFDRIRETFRKMRKMTTPQVIDHAITSTTSRTIITHGSTQMMVVSMLLFGGPTLHYFAVALTIGILFGIYSSIFVAAGIAMWLGVKREDLVKVGAKENDPNDPNAGAVV